MAGSINLVYFAWVRERLGVDAEQLALAGEEQTIADVLDSLSSRGPAYADIFSDISRLRFALDQDFAAAEAPLGDAKELAVFPPVTGG